MTDDATPAKVRLTDGLGPLPEREAWVRKWFAEHYQAGDVFYDGAEALTLAAAVQLVADAQAAERERCAQIVSAYRVPVGNSAADEMAAEWTMDALREIRDAIRGV